MTEILHQKDKEYCSRCGEQEVAKGTECVSFMQVMNGSFEHQVAPASTSGSKNMTHEFEKGPAIV
jgi:hypothetical protein